MALAAALAADGEPGAATFGRRVGEVLAASGHARVRLLLGDLIYLDELEAGSGRPSAWVRTGREPLLALARTLAECEVLDEQLVGLPVRQVADLVTSVGIDDQARPGPSHRVTRVERPGYACDFPDGGRQVLATASVRIAR